MSATIQVPEALQSRKFWMTVAGCLVTLGGMIQGTVPPSEGVVAIGLAVSAYVLAEAHVDASAAKAAAPPDPAPAADIAALIAEVRALDAKLQRALDAVDSART